MADKRPVFDLKICMACRICVSACPVGCLADDRLGVDAYNKGYPRTAADEDCTGCGVCAAECPVGAITMADLRP